MTQGPRGDELTPAEARLVWLLLLLRAEADRVETPLTRAVMNRLRWQIVVRDLARVMNGIVGSVAAGIALAFRLRPERHWRSR